jgi:lariat debranching enzyme
VHDENDTVFVVVMVVCQNTFHQYVTGEKIAYVPTIFIGGNHEASNILQSLYYGGWVAPNIYFLGFGGVVWFGGVRIAGISGIFNKTHYRMGHFERPPYNHSTMRSVYHQRELEVFRLAMLSGNIDVFLSHDWPTSIWDYGDKQRLLQTKPYFREEMAANDMGSPPLMHILRKLKPAMWFSAHLHVKFAAIVQHFEEEVAPTTVNGPAAAGASSLRPPPPPAPVQATRFLALDKVLPGRYQWCPSCMSCRYLQ